MALTCAVWVDRRGAGHPSGDRGLLPGASAGGRGSLAPALQPRPLLLSSTRSALRAPGRRSTHPFPAGQARPAPPSSPSARRPTGNDDIGAAEGRGLAEPLGRRPASIARGGHLPGIARASGWRCLSAGRGGPSPAAPSAVRRFANTGLVRLRRTLFPLVFPASGASRMSAAAPTFSPSVPLCAADPPPKSFPLRGSEKPRP